LYTAASLRTHSIKDLGKIANQLGVAGWRSMRKDELVRALMVAARSKAGTRRSAPPKRAKASVEVRVAGPSARRGKPVPKNPRVSRRIQRANEERARHKDLAGGEEGGNGSNGGVQRRNVAPAGGKDRIILLVRDAYWLQAVWELTRQSVERAQAAMAEHWHTAHPALRLIQLDAGATTSAAERVVREIEIHGGVRTWYIDLQDAQKSYRVDIGYLGANGKFFSLARSNAVTAPRPGNTDELDQNWSDIAENCEKIYALSGGYSDESGTRELQELFEERLGRPMGSPVATRFGVGADKSLMRQRDFLFSVDAEIIVYGATRPNAHVTLGGTPIKLRPDGTFSARLSMPDRRQVLPVVASSPDGVEQRTVVLAVERNTKVMEPMIKEANE
jgi:hypothetical protein